MNLPELRNPFTNALIVKVNADQGEYHRSTGGNRGQPDFIMSRSALMDFYECPSRWIKGYQTKSTDATEWGTLIDCLALSPKEFATRFAIEPALYPDAKTGEKKPWNNNANFCKDWNKAQGSKEIISAKDMALSDLAITSLFSDPKIKALIKCSARQALVMGEYHDKATGLVVPVKALLDLAPDQDDAEYGDCLADLKTCRHAGAGGWPKVVFEDQLHVQAAFYIDLHNAATLGERNTFRHILLENVPPFEPARRLLSAEFLEMGRATYIHALRFYCQCLKDQRWPGYDEMATECINGWALVQPKAWMVMV
jgi:hypothetical protein